MRLWQCACAPKPVKVRVASDDFQATCQRCATAFKRADRSGSGEPAVDLDGNVTTAAVTPVVPVVRGAVAATGGDRS
jgi:hypothetical protein